jgi:hypothetical protein
MVFICVCSCASRPAAGEGQLYVYLADNARYVLLPSGGIEQAMDMAQYISVSYKGHNYYFNAWVRADETGLEMTLFNELGAAMGELFYRDGRVQFSSPVIPHSFKPEYLVADFQLCFYDPLMLAAVLKNCGLVLETDGTGRRILKGKKSLIEIEKNHHAVTIINHLRNYTYTLEGDF